MNISKYEKQGFQGVDCNLSISLLEYGLIWKEYKYNLKKRGIVKGEILAITFNESTNNTDYGYFTKESLLSETWISFKDVSNYCGMSETELKNQGTGNLLSNLISYYGKENFGFD